MDLLAAFAPVFTLSVGLGFGAGFEMAPLKSLKAKAALVGSFAGAAAVAFLLTAWYFSSSLTQIYSFSNFSYAVASLPFLGFLGNQTALNASVLLSALLVISLAAGFTLMFKVESTLAKRKIPLDPKEADEKSAIQPQQNSSGLNPPKVNSKLFAFAAPELASFADEQALQRDEQTLMELFLYGKVAEVTSIANTNVSDGYVLDGVPQLKWETKKERLVLDSLVRKGFLKADLTDKLIACTACGSANIKIKKLCPECMSMRLHKEGLIEHFACGAVETQAAFESGTGNLVCPKCKGKLNLIGADYRMLPPAYTCHNCRARNSEPLLVGKCGDCGATADLNEEPEVFLYKYTANSELSAKVTQQIKPIDVCSLFFKSVGYTVVAPAHVSGRSGIEHLFDMLILGRVGWVELSPPSITSVVRGDNGNTVIQLLISTKPCDTEEMTRVYGMINDVECDSLIFVIPGMTDNARNYAKAYNMKVSEGKTIEEALANSKIPKAGGKQLNAPDTPILQKTSNKASSQGFLQPKGDK